MRCADRWLARGGAITCRFCGVVNVLSRHTSIVPTRSESDETVRIAGLWAQLEPNAPPSPYGPSMWQGLMEEKTTYGSETGVASARAAWREARNLFAANDVTESRVAAVAMLLAAHYGARGDRLEMRALLETALDMVKDPKLRHLICALLARTAAKDGRADDAVEWLRQCDPRPSDIYLDSQYRMALARIKIARGDPRGALDVIGANAGDVPIEPGNTYVLQLRIHAYEVLGDDKAAFHLLNDSFVTYGANVFQWLRVNDLAPRARAAEVRHIWRLRIGVLVVAFAIAVGVAALILSRRG